MYKILEEDTKVVAKIPWDRDKREMEWTLPKGTEVWSFGKYRNEEGRIREQLFAYLHHCHYEIEHESF